MKLDLQARALHWVFKIGNRKESIEFFRNTLGMQVLRHEEFEEGCKATCNGPYDGKWSKTMIGYGPEKSHFVMELTYNYGIGKYQLGNDFQGIVIHADQNKELKKILSPDGYPFWVNDSEKSSSVKKVFIGCESLARSLAFWRDILGMEVIKQCDNEASLSFGQNQVSLDFKETESKIDHGSAFGRIAFAVPTHQISVIEKCIKDSNHTILTPHTKLDTPGKPTVEVVILADPDGHEICFVGEEAFDALSEVDANASKLLDEAIRDDKSIEWFQKEGISKREA